jgi:branched-chain amino acid transport system permease protein
MFGTYERCDVRTTLIRGLSVVAAAIAITLVGLFFAGPAFAAPSSGGSSSGGPISAATSCSSTNTVGCVQGTLRDDNGNGVAKVKLTLSNASGDKASTTSNSNGTYIFKVKASGQYTLTLDTKTLPSGIKAATPSISVTATLGQLQPAVISVTGKTKGSVSQNTGPPSLGLQVWDQLSQGLLLGLLLALASIGLSLIYGTTGLSNFAHAEQVTLGGLMAYVFSIQLGINFIIATVIAVVICAASGYIQDWLIWKPLRRRGLGLTQQMVVTIGLSLALEYIFQYFFGSQVLPVTETVQRQGGMLDLTPNAYIAMAISVVVLVLIGLVLTRTRIGRATRAVSDNRALAAASGIDVDRIIRLVWTVSMGLAGLAGVLYALVNGGIQWSTGVQLLLLIFSAVTLGGLGTAFGALVGSLVIGIVVQMSSLVLSQNLKYATALVILIIVLLFRPQGILGRRERIG